MRYHQGVIRIDLTDVLRNPHDDPAMRERTGMDEELFDYVLGTDGAARIVQRASDLIRSEYARRSHGRGPRDPKPAPVGVHVFCRGGRHRSVAIATAIREALQGTLSTLVTHRDVTQTRRPALTAATTAATHAERTDDVRHGTHAGRER